jgi:hypothetical protein
MSRPSPDALFVALVLAPGTYSRNRYFNLFKEDALWRARRRAQVIRSLVRDLTEPWPRPGLEGKAGPDSYEERDEGETVFVEYRMSDLDYRRSAVLTRLEAATLHYALSQAGKGQVVPGDVQLVEEALQSLGGLPKEPAPSED